MVLVKALPQPSKKYGETVCCAGLTEHGEWKRLFPVRFRHLNGQASFARWDWVDFGFRRPTNDLRKESCHVFEDSISVTGSLPLKNRNRLLDPVFVSSATEAMEKNSSLALIRPRNTFFLFRKRKEGEIVAERSAYVRAAGQASLFDRDLAQFEPSTYEFYFKFEDGSGKHKYRSGDWETHAMFWRERQSHGEANALRWMSEVYNDEYPKKGMAFAIGNQAKRPQVWQLLGVIRLDESTQGELLL